MKNKTVRYYKLISISGSFIWYIKYDGEEYWECGPQHVWYKTKNYDWVKKFSDSYQMTELTEEEVFLELL